MPQVLPLVPSVQSYRFATALDGTSYIFDVRWNGRDESWYMDVLADDESTIWSGIRIVIGSLLGRRCVDERFPRGAMMAVDLTGGKRDATFDDLGTRVAVLFYTPEEFFA